MSWVPHLVQAYRLALESVDPSTQNAALLVNDEDWEPVLGDVNRFPRGVIDLPERWERPLKYKIIEHAERNVIYQATRLGMSTDGLTMVSPWAACSDCARAIIQSGIVCLVRHQQAGDRSTGMWLEEIQVADKMLQEAGVQVVDVSVRDLNVQPIRHSGELWRP